MSRLTTLNEDISNILNKGQNLSKIEHEAYSLFNYYIKNPPNTPEDLHLFINIYFGINIPKETYEPKHQSPFDFICDIFFEKFSDFLLLANRSGGKTFNISILIGLWLLFKKECEINSSGSILPQSELCFNYVKKLAYKKYINDSLHGKVKVHPHRIIEFKNENLVRVITASEEGFNGPHPAKNIVDEVELCKWSVLQQGLSMAKSNKYVKAQNIFLSTRKRIVGTMQRLIDRSEAMKLQIYKYNIFDVVEKCELEIECPKCDVWLRCKGRARLGKGFYLIEDFITKASTLEDYEWDSEWECKKPGGEGLIYSNFDDVKHILNEHKIGWLKNKIRQNPLEYKFICGLDFGYSVPTALIFIIIDKEKNYYIVEELYKKKIFEETIGDSIKKFYMNWTNEDTKFYRVKIYADPSRPDSIRKLQNLGFNVNRAKNAILEGIKEVSRMFGNYSSTEIKLFINDKCKNTIQEILGYCWEKDSKGEKPIMEDDHCCDALRYAIFTDKRSVGVRPITGRL